VVIGSRSQEKAQAVAAELSALLPAGSATVRGETNAEAAAAANIVVLSVPYTSQAETAAQIAEASQGKLVITVVVPLKPPKVSVVWRPEAGSAAQELQQQLGDPVQIVAAFQNIAAGHLRDLEWQPECDVLYTGDHKEAKAVARELIQAAGFVGIDAGPLANASVVEGLTALLIGINARHKVPNSGIRITGIAR
jgi:NADPH-dependent F420 reductase